MTARPAAAQPLGPSCRGGVASRALCAGGAASRAVVHATAEVHRRHAGPEKTRHGQCVMTKFGAELKVEDEGSKVISLILSLVKSIK